MKLNKKRTIIIALAFFSICMFWEVYDNIVPLYLKDLGVESAATRGVIMALDNILALVLLPFMGLLSDRTKSKMGRRMPYIVIGTFLTVTFLMLLNLVFNLGSLIWFIVILIFLLIFVSTYRNPAVSLMPDITPKPLRSTGNAIINLVGWAGGVIATVLMMFLSPIKEVNGENVVAGNGWALFIIIGVLMLLAIMVMVAHVKENKFAQERKEIEKLHNIGEETETQNEKKEKIKLKKQEIISLMLILSSCFLWYAAYNAIKTHFSIFSTTSTADGGLGLATAFTLPLLLSMVVGAITFIPASLLTKKIGRKKTIIIGIVLMLVSFITAMLTKDKTLLMVLFAFVGAGWAIINVNSFVMVVEMATEKTNGVYTGWYYSFVMAAQIITPIFSGLFIDKFGVRSLFPYATIFMMLALITMLFTKHGEAKKIATK